jgi:hypothetical protein
LTWTKSTRSGSGADCVEIARNGELVLVRDSKEPNGPILEFSRSTWNAFVSMIGRSPGDR